MASVGGHHLGDAALGVEALWAAVRSHEAFLDSSGARTTAMRRRLSDEVVEIVEQRIGRELAQRLEADATLSGLIDEVVGRRLDPHAAADRLYATVRRSG